MANELSTLEFLSIEDLLDSEAIEYNRSKDAFSVYEYNGIKIPRVTTIINDCFNREYLVNWALSFQYKQQYYQARDQILSIGTKVHEAIEDFLQFNIEPDIPYKKAPRQAPYIKKAYINFKNWFNTLIETGNSFELIGIEVPVTNPYYGGCVDCIAKINNAYYILDFKTSKKISYEYIIQVCAYMWTINNNYVPNLPHINGIGIIRIDKESDKYEDLFLNEFVPEQKAVIDNYIQGFGSILNAYYNKLNMEYHFNIYKRNYPGLLEVINSEETNK